MAEAGEDQREVFRQMGKTAVILGHTGATGRVLVKLLAQEKLFKKVTLIGRREVSYDREVIGPEFVSLIEVLTYSTVFSVSETNIATKI